MNDQAPSVSVVIPCFPGDQEQAKRLLRWIAELGKVAGKGYIACSDKCDVRELMALGKSAFESFDWIQDYEAIISDWSDADIDKPRSAQGPNSIFKQVAVYFFHKKRAANEPFECWLWLEPDAFPTSHNWIDEITHEYRTGRKPFMGAFVSGLDHHGRVVEDHMSGVGVYHQVSLTLVSGPFMATHRPFDLAEPSEIRSKATFTKRIVHNFRAAPFTSLQDFDARVSRDTLIYHACKDGSIVPFLRERLLGVVAENPGSNNGSAKSSSEPAAGETRINVQIVNAPKTWTESMRAMVAGLAKLADTQSRKASIQEELRKHGIIAHGLKRKPRKATR